MGAPTACEDAGVPNVCYNISTQEACPNTYLIYSRINWEPYFEYIISKAIAGEDIEVDWVGDMPGNSVIVTDLNTNVAAAGTQEAIDAAKAELIAGTRHVFDISTFITVNGEEGGPASGPTRNIRTVSRRRLLVSDGYFHESMYRSAPYFDARIDGIELLNDRFGFGSKKNVD